MSKPLFNGDVAVALFNGSDTTATISTSAAQAGLSAARNGYLVRDLWSRETILTTGDITATVAPHATVM